MNNEQTFVEITNKDIYDQLNEFKKSNDEQHKQIINRLDITNGKVKLSKWIATTALAFTLILLGYFIEFIIRS